jgi:hypothetical protein
MSVVPAISDSQLDYSSGVADGTHTPAKCAQLGKIVLTVTKRNPGQFTLPGFYRLLPQPVGLVIRAGRPDWPTRSTVTAKSIRSFSA